uniref:DNA replication licensing factor MCM3 n=1 Tax=Panagrellus redivivus TaxID=6233 RepID=A0A7E4UWU3_PANRE
MSTHIIDRDEENRQREITQEYLNFLDDSADDKTYTQKVEDLIKEQRNRLIVDINDVRRKLPERAKSLIETFVTEVTCFEQALRDMVARTDTDYAKDAQLHIGFEGAFGNGHVNPRSLKTSYLGHLVCCEGIVTRCSAVRPKIVKSVHFCPATKKTLEKKYTDATSYDSFPTSNAYPTEDENKNPLETEVALSQYKNHQTFSIQELPESAPAGQLPRSIDIICDDDLADRCKPGDRVRVVGLYRVLPNKQNGVSTGSFRSIIICNNILLTSKEVQPNFSPEDIKNIRKMSRRKDILELLSNSLAPSIFGNEEVKKAILCLLLGGKETLLDNGSRLRGDINVLLIGDPSVAKSQLLRYVLHTAPRAIATTGRGSSGVGLTAAVVTDADTGERNLEAGAMVMADRGIVCIDEFDKMTDMDRTAIHEVMEQGRVSISKAGIHAKLNARCSVLAAANPVMGRYNLYKSPMENIGMQDSLLSRFDLIFVMLDEHDVDRDHQVAENVIKLQTYRAPGVPDGTVLPIDNAMETLSTFDPDADTNTNADIFEKNRGWTAVAESQKILSAAFMRKYIYMAKAIKPQLTEAASAYIATKYAELRSFEATKTADRERTMPVTARQLETMIRLSTAMAKARLAKTVELSDAERAYQLLHYACFKEKPKARQEAEEQRKGHGHHDADGSDVEMDDATDTQSSTTTRASRAAKRRAAGGDADMEVDESQDVDDTPVEPSAKRARPDASVPAISVDRLRSFRAHLRKAFDMTGKPDDLNPLATIKANMLEVAGNLPYTEAEFIAGFERLEADNKIMIHDDEITLI